MDIYRYCALWPPVNEGLGARRRHTEEITTTITHSAGVRRWRDWLRNAQI